MYLYIDTTNGNDIFLAITDKNKLIDKKIIQAHYQQAEKLLPNIDKLLLKVQNNLDLSLNNHHFISGIIVVNGPGPFTATRMGVATGNALAYAWQVPIVSIKNTEFSTTEELILKGYNLIKQVKKNNIIEPFYNQEPNITIK